MSDFLDLNFDLEEFDEATRGLEEIYKLADENAKLKKKIDIIKNSDIKGKAAEGKNEIIKKLEKKIEDNANRAKDITIKNKNNKTLSDRIYSELLGGSNSNIVKKHIRGSHDWNSYQTKNKNKQAEERRPGTYEKLQKAMKESVSDEELLEFFNSATFDGMVEDIIREAAEFEDKCPSMNPEVSFDSNNSGNHEIPVPGGDKERPNGKPYDGEYGPSIPGGDSEKPNAKPYDGESGVPNPAKVLLDEDTYNNALTNLQKSFKECGELLDMIVGAQVVTESAEQRERRLVEEALDESFFNMYVDGPLYENVVRGDKDQIKGMVKTIRPLCKDYVKNTQKLKFYLPVRVGRTIHDPRNDKDWSAWWSTRLYQVVGAVVIDDKDIKYLTNDLNEKFKEELGDYKICAVHVTKTFIDLFRTKFNIKNQLTVYMLFVDRKIPAEINKITKEADEQYKADEQNKADEQKE